MRWVEMAAVALAVDVALIGAGLFALKRTVRRMLGAGFPLGVRTAGNFPPVTTQGGPSNLTVTKTTGFGDAAP